MFRTPAQYVYDDDITLQKASWPEWGHDQDQSILTVWPAGIIQHFLYTPDLDENMNMK